MGPVAPARCYDWRRWYLRRPESHAGPNNEMRLKSAIWVAAFVRRCHAEGAFAAVRRRGAEEAGAIFIKLNRLDGTGELFGPAPQSVFDDARPAERWFSRCLAEQPAPEAKIEERLARELRFDPDVWIIEVEDRSGRHFLDVVG
jgi:hypothetical protein